MVCPIPDVEKSVRYDENTQTCGCGCSMLAFPEFGSKQVKKLGKEKLSNDDT